MSEEKYKIQMQQIAESNLEAMTQARKDAMALGTGFTKMEFNKETNQFIYTRIHPEDVKLRS